MSLYRARREGLRRSRTFGMSDWNIKSIQHVDTHSNGDDPECPSPSDILSDVGAANRAYTRISPFSVKFSISWIDTNHRSCQPIQHKLNDHQMLARSNSPISGPMPNRLILAPRFSCGIRSLMLAPPSVTGQTPKHPAKNRNAIS